MISSGCSVKTLTIHRWTLDDIPFVQHIGWTTWLSTYEGFIPESDLRAFFDEYYTAEALGYFCHAEFARGFVGDYDSTPVGFAKTNFNPGEKTFYLNSLYILPEYQGKGIGSKLLRACEDFALSLSVDEIRLGVMTQNLPALNWYRRIGFQFEKEEPFTMGNTIVKHLIGFRKINRTLDGN